MPANRVTSRSPWHIVLVLDDSFSMQGPKIAMLNEAIRRMIAEMTEISGGMKPYFRLSIIRFGDDAEVLSEAENEQEIDLTLVTSLRGDSGLTNATAALEEAYALLERTPARVTEFEPFLFFFSDGQPNDKVSALEVGDRLKAMNLASGRLHLITVGFGDVDEEFMRHLGACDDGSSRFCKLTDERHILEFFPKIGTLTVSQTMDSRPAAKKLADDFMVI